jgi:hypothetical protein
MIVGSMTRSTRTPPDHLEMAKHTLPAIGLGEMTSLWTAGHRQATRGRTRR